MALNEQQTQDITDIQAGEQQFDPQNPGPGDPPKKSPVTAKVVPIKSGEPSTQGLSPDAISRLTTHVTEGTSGVKQDVPHNLSFQPKAGQDNALLRAQDQGVLAQLGKTAGNLIPNVAADIIDMTGQLANVAGTISGSSDYNSGGMGTLATAIRDPFGEVYRTHPDKVFDMGDSAWWLQNIAGFVEGAASFVLPGEGEAALFSKLGKVATEVAGGGKALLEATQVLGHTASAFSMGYLMSASAGKKIYDEAYKTNYDRFIRQGYDPGYADDQAKHMAADGAAKTVQIGTLLNGALNLTALAPLFKGTPQEAMQGIFKSGEGAIAQGESLAGWKARLEAMSPEEVSQAYRRGMTSHGFQAFQVGLQGLNTEYAEKTGLAAGTGQQAKQLDAISNYFDKVSDQEGALNMLSGLLGGLTQNILMDRVPLHRIVKIDPATNKPIYKGGEESGKYETQLVSARTRDMMGNRQYFKSIKDAVIQDITHMTGLQDQMKAAAAKGDTLKADNLRRQLMAVGDLNAITLGITDSWQNVYTRLRDMKGKPALTPEIRAERQRLSDQLQEQLDRGEDMSGTRKELDDLMRQQRKPGEAVTEGYAADATDTQYTQEATEAIEQLKVLQKIHDRLTAQFAPYTGDQSMAQLQDHVFHKEANNYLLGRSIAKEEGYIARDEAILSPLHQYKQDMAVHKATEQKIREDGHKLDKAVNDSDHVAMAEIMKEYGINAYQPQDLPKAAEMLGKQLTAKIDELNTQVKQTQDMLHADTGFNAWKTGGGKGDLQAYFDSIGKAYPIDDRLVERKANVEKAKVQHEEQKRQIAELRSSDGRAKFMEALQKNKDKWKEALDEEAAKETENLFMKQQDKEMSAKLDKEQVQEHIAGRTAAINENNALMLVKQQQIQEHRSKLEALGTKKGFFKNAKDLPKKLALRTKIAILNHEMANLAHANTQHNEALDGLGSAEQEAAVGEDTARNAHREDVENDLHSQQDATAPVATEPAPTDGIADNEAPIPESVSPQEAAYADLSSLPADIQRTLDNLELMMPADFSRDLVHKALQPYINDLRLSAEQVHDITEKMKDWWENKEAPQPIPDAVPPLVGTGDELRIAELRRQRQDDLDMLDSIGLPADVKALQAQTINENYDKLERPEEKRNQVSDIPEPDSTIISFSAAMDPENLEKNPAFTEVGAKALTAMKINSRSIQYMRVEKGNKLMFLPLYDKLDPTFNRNILKPGFISDGDSLRFEVDKDWNGEVTLDKADAPDEYGMPTGRADSFADYTTSDGKIIMSRLDDDLEPGYANVPIKIVHEKSGETVGYVPRTDWVTAKREDSNNYRNIEDNIYHEDGTVSSGNVEAQKEMLMAVRAEIARAHNEDGEAVKTHVSNVGSGHVFLSTAVNVNTEKSKLSPKLAKNLLPDKKLQFAILNKGTMMVGKGTPHNGPANFDEHSLAAKYKTGTGQWNNVPMVLLPMPNGKVTESPLFTRRLSERQADIHTVAKAVESYLVQGTAAETAEHTGIIDKLQQHTGYDISTANGLRSFINQYYTYTQKFNEVHTRANAETSGPKVPRFMVDIPDLQPGEQKAAIKVGTSFSGSVPIYALTRDGKLNQEFDQALRDGLQTHYKNMVFTSSEIKGINDKRPIAAVTIQRDGKIRVDRYDSYNDYAKSFASTVVYGLHTAADGTYLYGANPVTEFDFNSVIQSKGDSGEVREGDQHIGEDYDDLISGMMNSAVKDDQLPANRPVPEDTKVYTRDTLTQNDKGATLNEEGIRENISKLYDEAADNPEQAYHIDIPGGGRSRFKLSDGTFMNHFKLAQMLNDREIPYNIRLSDEIKSVLENTPRRFLNSMMFQDDSIYTPLDIDDKILGEQLNNTFVPVRDLEGNHTGGYFSPERQEQVVDSVVKAISLQLDRRPLDEQGKPIRVSDMMKLVKNNVFANLKKIYERVGNGETVRGFDVTTEQAKQMAAEYGMVLNSFEPADKALSFWGEAMKKLDQLGIRVKESKRPVRDNEITQDADGNPDIVSELEGTARNEWDSHFEHNPMDSASSRVKMFIATTTDSTIGQEPVPPKVKLSIHNPGVRQRIVEGKYLFTAITPAEAKAMGLDKPGTEGFNTIDGKGFRITNVGPIQEGDVHAQKISYEENKDVKPGDIKLQLTPWKPKPEQLIPNRNYLGLPKLADYEVLYEDAMASLGDTPRNLEAYIAKLKDDGRNGRPNLFALATNLEKAGTQIKNEFVSVMTLHYQPFTTMLVDAKTDKQGNPYYALRPINTNRASQLNTIVDHWQQSQKFSPILEKSPSGTTIVSAKVAKQLKADLNEVNALFEKGDGTASTKAAELLGRTLEYNGIVLPDKAVQSFIGNTARWTKKTSLAGDFRKQFAVTADGKAQGLVSAFILRLAGEGGEEEMLDSMEDKSYQLNNPLYMEGTAMKVLARVTAAHSQNLYSNTHKSGEGKTIYDWGLPHKLSNDFNKLKTNEQWRLQFADSDFSKRSWLLEHISNNTELRDRASLSYLDTIKAVKGKQDSGTTRPAMSDREQLFTAVGLFQNGTDNRYAHYLSLTHSDRSTTPVYMNMPRIPVVTTMRLEYDKITGTQTPRFGVHDEVVKRMYDVFLSEYDRINKAAQVIEKEGGYNDARYEKGSQYFYALPQFNHERMRAMIEEGKITEADFNSVWMMGEKKLNVLEGRGFKEAVDKMLRLHVEELMTNTVREWKDKGIVSDENVPFNPKYLTKVLSNVGIYTNKDGTHRTRDNQEVPPEYINRLSAQLAARDFAVNSFLFNTSLSQVFFGDPAQNWKGSVEKTMVEYGKRLTQFISPRKEGNWNVPDYTAITVKDFTTKADYLGELSKAYRDINATDAQEITTVMERLNVARAYGRISDTMYNEMAGIVKEAKGGYYEFIKPEHLEFIMQPEKPLYSGSRAPFQGAILNDYVKSSAYPLYPPLLVGKELDKVRIAMEKGGIDRLNFESAKKVGIPAESVQLFDSNGRVKDDMFSSPAWTGTDKGTPVPSARQQLSRDNFGLSQEVPYDELKNEIRTVSQENKLITESIATIKTPFDYKGEQLSGAELTHRKEEIRKELIGNNLKKLLDETGAIQDEHGDIVVKDRTKMYDRLLKHAEDQGGYSPNDLAILRHMLPGTDELIIPIMYSPSAAKFESLVMSMINGVTDIYMPGKSFVQASSAGYRQVKAIGEMSEQERGKVVRVGDSWDGGELKTLRKDENGKVLPAQVILPFNFQVNGKAVKLERYITTDEHGVTRLNLEKIPVELLQQVAARIPNSGHNLMLPTEIVGFVPDEMGDLAIVPDAITKQMGSDFDVDKLYTYRRGYTHDKDTDSFKVIPNESDNTDGKLKNDYFDMHWGVLMHPEMTDKVLSPLDKEDLKSEAAQIESWENKGKRQLSFFDPIYQLRDFQSQKDAKQLVGASSLSVTFNSVIQDKGLTIGMMAYDEKADASVPTVMPIKLKDEDGKVRSLSHLSGYGRSEYKADGKKSGEMRSKNDNHVMQQAEFLDYSKNRISDKVHLTVNTYAASAALTQLQEPDGAEYGWSPSIKYNTRLLSQPIIQEYSALMSAAQDTFSEGFDADRKNTIIEQLGQKYIEAGKIEPKQLAALRDAVSFEDLTDALKKGESQKDYHLKQLKALQLFKELDQVGTQMKIAQSTINQDVNGAGPSLLTPMSKDVTRSNLETAKQPGDKQDLKILNAGNLYVRRDGKPTEQGALYDTIHQAAYGIAGEMFPYQQMKPMFDYVMDHTNRNDLSVDMQKNIFNAMKSYVFSHPKLGLWEDPVGTRAKLLYGSKSSAISPDIASNLSLAQRVLEAKNTWAKNDVFLQRLQTDIDPDGLRPDYVKYQASKVTKMDQDENTRHWVDLLTSDDPTKRELGHDLIRYAYLTGGIQDAQNYIKFLPYSFLIGTDFGHKLRELTSDLQKLVMADSFRTQVFQHNPQIAKTISADFSETGSTFEHFPERFALPALDMENLENNPAKTLIVRAEDTDGKRRQMYPEFLSHYSKDSNQWVLYKKASLMDGGQEAYVRIDTLGNGSIDEYAFTGDALATRSLDPSNRSFAYDNIEPAYRMLNSAVTNRHGADVLKDVELKTEGGETEIRDMLTRLAADKSVPEHNRVLSSWLATLHDQTTPILETLSGLLRSEIEEVPKLRYKVTDQAEISKVSGAEWAAAVMTLDNRLYLNKEDLDNKAELAMFTNHELLHYHTAALTGVAENRDYLLRKFNNNNFDKVRKVETIWKGISERHPEVKKAMDELEEVRSQAEAALKDRLLKRGLSFEQEYNKVIKEGKMESPMHKWIYATASKTEFISHAMTDLEFMKWLNKQDYKGEPKGFLAKIADVVKRIMSGIAKALGTDVRKNSLLEQAVDKSMALMVIGRADAVPGRDQMATPNNMESGLNWSNNAISNPTLTAMDRLAGKLREQHDELVNSLTGRLSKEEYSAKRTQLDQIEDDIDKLRQDQSFEVATEIGERHLDWVAKTLEIEQPTPSQIMTANRVLEVWSNLIPLVYGEGEGADEPNEGFAKLAAKAQDMGYKMLRKSQRALIDLSSGIISMRDYSPTQLKDIPKDQALLRDVVSAAGAKVTQYIGTNMQQTARHAMDDITRLIKETRAVEDGLKATVGDLPSFYDKFFQQNEQKDAWGLVQRFSQNWYDFRRGERKKRQSALKRIDEGGGDGAQKAQMKSQVWDQYWKSIDSNAIFADTRKLFDRETGERLDNDEAKKHIEELEKHTDKEAAAELVDEAQRRYRQYLDHKEPLFDSLDAEETAGTKTAKQVQDAKNDFVNKWSPNIFFQNRGGKLGSYGGSDYYAKMAPRKAVKGFYDEKFDGIQRDPTALKFYTWLNEKMTALKEALPVKVNDEHLGANFFPVVNKGLVTDMLDIPEYIRTLGEKTMRSLGATPWEEAMNASSFRQLPIDYIDRDLEKHPLQTRSKDIPRVLEVFGMMALHYKHFSDARDGIDMGEAILQKLDQARAAGTTQMSVGDKLVSVQDGLKNTLEAVRYMKDYLMYRKARQLEGKSDYKLYSLNPVKQIKSTNRVKELLAEREKISDQILNGELDPEEGSARLKPINDELQEYEGLRLYGSKLGDKLITINQLKTLSYNPFSGIANMTFGVVSAAIHANGGRDYSWKDISQALKMMMSSTAKWATLGTAESKMAEKILAVMDRTGVIGDVVDSHYGKIDIRDRKAAWRHAINPYNWMRSGDYFMKGLTTTAMLLHDKVKVTEGGVEKEIRLWDALDQEGKWDDKRFGERKDWYSEDVKEQTSWDKFRNKAVRVNMIIHGNQDKSSPKLANRYILGRLLGQFRMSWLPEGWYSRFQKEHFDIQLDREVKGRYRTIAQLGFGGYAMVTLKQLYSVIGKVDPYTGRTRLDGKALTETDRENMRRNFAELAFVSGIMGMVVMTRAMASTTDDEKEQAKYKLLMNMLIRNKQDLQFYASPSVFDTVTRDVIPAANVLKDYGKAIAATGRIIFDDDYQWSQWLLKMAHAGLPVPQATLINKTKYMITKDLDNSQY